MKSFRIKVGTRWHNVEIQELRGPLARVLVDGEPFDVEIEEAPTSKGPSQNPPPNLQGAAPDKKGKDEPTSEEARLILSPVHARVVGVMVRKGQRVSSGTEVCVLEAMKMEQSIRALTGGVVKAIYIKPGENVAQGDLLIELE